MGKGEFRWLHFLTLFLNLFFFLSVCMVPRQHRRARCLWQCRADEFDESLTFGWSDMCPILAPVLVLQTESMGAAGLQEMQCWHARGVLLCLLVINQVKWFFADVHFWMCFSVCKWHCQGWRYISVGQLSISRKNMQR